MDPRAETPRWQAVYVHPDKPHVEVTLKTSTEPAPRRMFLIAGGPTLLHLKSAEPINNHTTKESDVHMAPRQARKRPKKSGTRRAAPEPEVVDDDLDGLDELDIDDLDDLDLEDDVDDLDEDEIEEEDEDEDDDDLEDEDDIEDEEDEEIEDEEDDDLGDLDDLDEDEEDEEPEPAPRKRSSGRKAASSGRTRAPVKDAPANGDKPLTEAQGKMLKAAVKNKNGAKVENIGQRRTAEALIGRGLVKWMARTDQTRVTATAAGKKYDPSAPAPAPAAKKSAAPAKRQSSSKRASASKSTGGNGSVPKGMVGVAKIAEVCKVHEETVRRVLRMNEDRFPKDEDHGRYLFTKDDAREVIREVKAYTKYTGGSRGRPVGARTELPEGKVGPQWIADEAGVHRNTVYKFLNKHAERFERYISEDGLMWIFPEGVATKIAAKLGA